MIKKSLYLFFALLLSANLFAADVKFNVAVSRNILSTGERFSIKFSLNSKGENFIPPDFSDFRVLSGPNKSTSMSWINGNRSTEISYSYVLMAVKEGDFNIGPAKVTVGDEVLKTDPVEIMVKKGAKTSSGQQQGSSGNNDSKKGDEISSDIFIRPLATKTDVYVGEAMTVSYKLYNRSQLVGVNLEKLPSYNGFWSQSLSKGQQQIHWERVNYNGKQYDAGNINQDLLFPQRPGKLELDEMEITATVRKKSKKQGRSLLEQFFGSYKDVKYKIANNPLKITVKPLPEKNKPENFSGAVGKFNIEITADKTELKANDAITIKVNIKGTGNIPLMDEPEIDFPTDFEVYDPEIIDNTNATYSGVKGTRTYKYLVIPRHKGEFEIPSLKLNYFDPGDETYHTKETKSIAINVLKGEEEIKAPSTHSGGVNKEAIKNIGSDIRYIKNKEVKLRKKGSYFINSPVFYLLSLLPLLIIFTAFLLRKKIRERNNNLVSFRRRKAKKMASKRLSTAKKHLVDNNTKEFYEEVFKALYGYIGDKMNIPVADLNKDNIEEQLLQYGVDSQITGELIDTIDHCEMARFAPVSELKPRDVYNKASNIITTMEQNIRS